MRVVIFSDIHANLEAYSASILDIARRGDADAIWCAGDLVGYGADPERCVALSAALAGVARPPADAAPELGDAVTFLAGKLQYVVAGNHDAAVTGETETENFNRAARAAAFWTASVISARARSYLISLPMTAAVGDATLVHASPVKPEEFQYVTTVGDAALVMLASAARVVFFGHTHQPVMYEFSGGEARACSPGRLRPDGRYMVNVGSVGQPRDGDPRAAYTIYDVGENRVETIRLEYDVDAAAEKIRRAGLPETLSERLYHGW